MLHRAEGLSVVAREKVPWIRDDQIRQSEAKEFRVRKDQMDVIIKVA
jgi:hypothetical protein